MVAAQHLAQRTPATSHARAPGVCAAHAASPTSCHRSGGLALAGATARLPWFAVSHQVRGFMVPAQRTLQLMAAETLNAHTACFHTHHKVYRMAWQTWRGTALSCAGIRPKDLTGRWHAFKARVACSHSALRVVSIW